MGYEMTGPVVHVGETEQVSEKFRKRLLVVELEDDKYPQTIAFDVVQDKCDDLDAINVGDRLTVHFDLRGRAWKDKFFSNLQAWKWEVLDADKAAIDNIERTVAAAQAATAGVPLATPAEDDEVPF